MSDLMASIDAGLNEWIDKQTACPRRLREALRYTLLAPGKRLRPRLVLLAAEACEGLPARAMNAAVAVEMVHAYSLIHDDLPAMDDDDLRRGRPTCHVAFDEATAILAGDALLTGAFAVLAEGKLSAEVAIDCIRELAQAAGAEGMVGGQADDLDPNWTPQTVEELAGLHGRKTGALIRASVRMGAQIAEANAESLAALTLYGEHIGLAFQIMDDWLDAYGDDKTMGKRTRKDAKHGKVTYPLLVGREQSLGLARTNTEHACRALEAFGERGAQLRGLARYICDRHH